MHIKEKITDYRKMVKRLQEEYKELVQKIKDAFFEHEDYWDKTSKQKPRSEMNVMHAAYCYATVKKPKSSFSFDLSYNISQAEEWKSNPRVLFDYFLIYDEAFKDRYGSTSPVYAIRKKNIKLLETHCKSAWQYSVKEDKTTLGFEEWMNRLTPDVILEYIKRAYEGRVDVVTERKLYLKDIVLIYPKDKKFAL